jgi:hypothetical protein
MPSLGEDEVDTTCHQTPATNLDLAPYRSWPPILPGPEMLSKWLFQHPLHLTERWSTDLTQRIVIGSLHATSSLGGTAFPLTRSCSRIAFVRRWCPL